MVLELAYGGLGDALVFTSLPRLLKETYGISFYLSHRSLDVFRHHNIFQLCFEYNPYFCGIKNTEDTFRYNHFSSDLSISTLITGKGDLNVVERIERQFNVAGNGVPEIYYKPFIDPALHDTVLVDRNWIYGKTHNLYYDEQLLEREIEKAKDPDRKVLYVEPGGQDLFRYTDMIASSKHFIGLVSGGNVLAAALRKNATIIVPENQDGGSLSNFLFPNAGIQYVRNKSLKQYMKTR